MRGVSDGVIENSMGRWSRKEDQSKKGIYDI